MKRSLLLVFSGLLAIGAATIASPAVEARSTEQSIKNRLDPRRITSSRVHRHDYAARRYRWARDDYDYDDYRYRRYAGWHRYYDRPYGWHDRGCVGVGAIWFCP